HQHPDPAVIESRETPPASVLALIRVDGVRGNSTAREMPHDAVRAMFGSSEHQRPLNISTLQDIDEQRSLVGLIDKQNFLIDFHGNGGGRSGCNRDRIL